ncbi:MAG: uridine kinase [Oscillospiraceae bacterium]|nr:uridine kinase [Oscillospiraceae bacterium]
MSDTLILGVAGGSGSGKTTLVRALVERFGEDITVISHDNYYKAHNDLTYDERALLNYDHPDAFETDLLIEHLRLLRQGRTVHCPVYDFTQHNRSDDVLEIAPKKVIVIEGILIFADPMLRNEMDVRIFVDADSDVRLCRRIRRDVRKRGRTLESVIEQYLATVKPMHEQFVEPSKKFANVIVPEGGKNFVALEMIMHRIQKHIDGSV